MWSCLLKHEGVSKRLVICEENGAMFGANRQEKAFFFGGGDLFIYNGCGLLKIYYVYSILVTDICFGSKFFVPTPHIVTLL